MKLFEIIVQPAYGWIKKGVRKEIPANSGRSRLNLSGAIDVVNHKVIVEADQTLDANSTIKFFRRKLEWKRLQSNEEYFEEEEVVTGQMPF